MIVSAGRDNKRRNQLLEATKTVKAAYFFVVVFPFAAVQILSVRKKKHLLGFIVLSVMTRRYL